MIRPPLTDLSNFGADVGLLKQDRDVSESNQKIGETNRKTVPKLVEKSFTSGRQLEVNYSIEHSKLTAQDKIGMDQRFSSFSLVPASTPQRSVSSRYSLAPSVGMDRDASSSSLVSVSTPQIPAKLRTCANANKSTKLNNSCE